MNKILEIQKKVLRINIEDANELLKWFAEAYYYNQELINVGVYNELYAKLSTIYKPLTEDKNGLELLKQIHSGEKSDTMENLSFIVIEQIMIGLKGGIGLDVEHGIHKVLFDYHYKYNKEFITELFMDKLKDSIGDKVTVIGISDKNPIMEVGKLKDVDEYQGFTVDDEDYRFIGYKYYIKMIRDENKMVLYQNPRKYDMAMLTDPSEIDIERIKIFGKEKNKRNKKLA